MGVTREAKEGNPWTMEKAEERRDVCGGTGSNTLAGTFWDFLCFLSFLHYLLIRYVNILFSLRR